MNIKKLKKIMYVEDEIDIQIVAKLALEDIAGFEVEICSSGMEALLKVASINPDLILLDAMMPGMDGPTTLKELRNLEVSRNIPVIFLTAKVQGPDVEKFKSYGALDVLSKPFDPLSLGKSILALWNKIP